MATLARVCCWLMLLCSLGHAAEMTLRLATYNVRYEEPKDHEWRAWPQRLQGLIATIRRMDPDVLGIQEALHGQVADLRLSLPDYEFYGQGRDDGQQSGEYAGIFYRRSRFQADPQDAGVFWLSDRPEVPGSRTWGNEIPRITTWIHLIDQKSRRGFTIYNTHWDHRHQGSRLASARLLQQRIDSRKKRQDPVILLGDFNATEGNPAVDALAGRQRGWAHALVDTYHTLHPQIKARRTLHFWSNSREGWLKVDHILASRPVRVKSAEIVYPRLGETPASDHFPVSAVISWP